MMLQITDADIAWVERLLLPAGCTFNEERRNFIKCMESYDVVACPGSGKTTALLAKLLILATYMPFLDGRGLCVLTHTNVAIDEIKRRAGSAADVLFHHPNFFGTIQEFTNRFLAIPAYAARFGQRHITMDEDIYATQARNFFFDHNLLWNGAIYGPIANRIKSYSKEKKIAAQIERFTEMEFRFDGDFVSYIHGGKTVLKGSKTPAKNYPVIHSAKYGLLEKGYLRYQDAFPLALWYLHTYPSLSEVFRCRFAHVFVDEAQDTNEQQLKMFTTSFPRHSTLTIQCLGDPNQSIYQANVMKDMLWSPTEPALPFSDSLRYGASISKVLDTVRVDRSLTLEPNQKQSSQPPHMLVFDLGSEEAVLPAFGALIREYNLHELKDPKFSAVGWVGKDKTDEGKACLRSYFPEYQKSLTNNSRWFSTLLSYIYAMDVSLRDAPRNKGTLIDMALGGVVHAIRLVGLRHPRTQRPFTVATFKSHLKQTNDSLQATLRLALAEWILAFCQGDITVGQFRDAVSAFVRTHFVDDETTKFIDFLDSDSIDFEPPTKEFANKFVSEEGDLIEVGTVHSVKGETHNATLYLETFHHARDSKRLLPFCSGLYPAADSKKARHRENLKIAHVAFSRPTHLLAFACCDEHVTGHETELEAAGWVVRKVSGKSNGIPKNDI